MSAEKRLTAYSMIEQWEKGLKRPIINKEMVQAHIKMIDYQLQIRKHIYEEEITGNDLYKDIRKIFFIVRAKKKGKKGYVKWCDFYTAFKNKYRSRYPLLMQARTMQQELKALHEMKLVIYDDLEDERGKFLKCLI